MYAIRRILGTVIVALLLLGAAYAVYALVFQQKVSHKATEDLRRGDRDKQAPVIAQVDVKKPHITHYEQGKRTWRLSADSIDADTVRSRTVFTEASGRLFRNPHTGRKQLSFSSPRTVYDAKTKKVIVEGRVTGSLHPEGQKITADNMTWDDASGVLHAENVKLMTATTSLAGKRLKLTRDDSVAYITGGAEIRIKVRKKQTADN